MPRLKIETSKSLYKPIEIEIDGKIYPVKRLTRDVILKIGALTTEVGQGNFDSAFELMEIFLGKSKVIDKLDIQQIKEITGFIVQEATATKKEEKNGSRPGDEKSPS